MVPEKPLHTGLLLIALGLAVLGAAAALGGMPADSVYQYTAAEISYEDEELHADPVPTQRSINAHQLSVDDRIVCLPSITRECYLELNALDEGGISGYPVRASYDYLYSDGQFYELTRDLDAQTMGHEPVPVDEVFSRLTVSESEADATVRTAIEDGTVRTTHQLQSTDTLIEVDGDYYTVYRSGSKQYDGWGAFCSSAGDGFCDQADQTRYGPTIVFLIGAALGMVGIVVGGTRIRSELADR